MVDLLQRSVAAEEAIRDTIRASLGRTLAVPAPIAPPALPSLLAGGVAGGAVGGSGSGVAVYVTINTEFSGPVTAADSGELSRFVEQRILDIVQGSLATELLVALRRAGVARSN